jgi:hypothetical protein
MEGDSLILLLPLIVLWFVKKPCPTRSEENRCGIVLRCLELTDTPK